MRRFAGPLNPPLGRCRFSVHVSVPGQVEGYSGRFATYLNPRPDSYINVIIAFSLASKYIPPATLSPICSRSTTRKQSKILHFFCDWRAKSPNLPLHVLLEVRASFICPTTPYPRASSVRSHHTCTRLTSSTALESPKCFAPPSCLEAVVLYGWAFCVRFLTFHHALRI